MSNMFGRVKVKRGFSIIGMIFFLIIFMHITFAEIDSDGDGLADGADKCDDTTQGSTIDYYGCDCSQKSSDDCIGEWCCEDFQLCDGGVDSLNMVWCMNDTNNNDIGDGYINREHVYVPYESLRAGTSLDYCEVISDMGVSHILIINLKDEYRTKIIPLAAEAGAKYSTIYLLRDIYRHDSQGNLKPGSEISFTDIRGAFIDYDVSKGYNEKWWNRFSDYLNQCKQYDIIPVLSLYDFWWGSGNGPFGGYQHFDSIDKSYVKRVVDYLNDAEVDYIINIGVEYNKNTPLEPSLSFVNDCIAYLQSLGVSTSKMAISDDIKNTHLKYGDKITPMPYYTTKHSNYVPNARNMINDEGMAGGGGFPKKCEISSSGNPYGSGWGGSGTKQQYIDYLKAIKDGGIASMSFWHLRGYNDCNEAKGGEDMSEIFAPNQRAAMKKILNDCKDKQRCNDGTLYGQCSSTKPKYCDNGNLVNNCLTCKCTSGTCQPDGSCKSEISNGLAVDINNPHWLTYGNEHVFLQGISSRGVIFQGEREGGVGNNPLERLRDMAANGGNYVRTDVGVPTILSGKSYPKYVWKRTGPGNALDGKPKFDFEKLDDSYFDELVVPFLEKANELGIVIELTLFDANYWEAETWDTCYWNPSTNINLNNIGPEDVGSAANIYADGGELLRLQKKYVDKVIEKTKGFNNIIYELYNEMPVLTNRKISKEWIQVMTDHIKSKGDFLVSIDRNNQGKYSIREYTSYQVEDKSNIDFVVVHSGWTFELGC